MSGTKAGGQQARDTNYNFHGKDFYAKIGAIGGRTSHGAPKGFAANRELARIAGKKGGHISKRTNEGNKAMSHDWREDEPIGEYVDKDGKDIGGCV